MKTLGAPISANWFSTSKEFFGWCPKMLLMQYGCFCIGTICNTPHFWEFSFFTFFSRGLFWRRPLLNGPIFRILFFCLSLCLGLFLCRPFLNTPIFLHELKWATSLCTPFLGNVVWHIAPYPGQCCDIGHMHLCF